MAASFTLDGIDYDNSTMIATFVAGSTTANIKIPIVDDTVVDEEDEKFNLTLNILPTTGVRVKFGTIYIATAVIIDTSTYAKFITILILNDVWMLISNCEHCIGELASYLMLKHIATLCTTYVLLWHNKWTFVTNNYFVQHHHKCIFIQLISLSGLTMTLQVLPLFVLPMDQDLTFGKEIMEIFHPVQWDPVPIILYCIIFCHLIVVITGV